MPPSAAEQLNKQSKDGHSVAVLAQVLYLGNLLLAPGIAFLALLWLYLKHANSSNPIAQCHLRQTLSASIWAGILLVIVTLSIVALGGFGNANTWVVLILYFTICHTSLVMLGIIGLAKAMAGQIFRFPLVGRACDQQD